MPTAKTQSAFVSAPDNYSMPEHVSTNTVYAPEENPFTTLFVDITHKCNMECGNCYVPNREIPDLDTEWLYDILSRLPRRTRIRLSGGEPTLRNDLPEIVRRIRKLGHHPVILTNGLKLADRDYVKQLKKAGIRTVHYSFNGGFDREAYIIIDGMDCLDKKVAALKNMHEENLFVTLGIIMVRNFNEHVLTEIWQYIKNHRQIRELHLRSVGAGGRYMDTGSFSLEEMFNLFVKSTGTNPTLPPITERPENMADFKVGKIMIQITQWPDLGSKVRGRLAPDGTLQPCMEHAIANDGGY